MHPFFVVSGKGMIKQSQTSEKKRWLIFFVQQALVHSGYFLLTVIQPKEFGMKKLGNNPDCSNKYSTYIKS